MINPSGNQFYPEDIIAISSLSWDTGIWPNFIQKHFLDNENKHMIHESCLKYVVFPIPKKRAWVPHVTNRKAFCEWFFCAYYIIISIQYFVSYDFFGIEYKWKISSHMSWNTLQIISLKPYRNHFHFQSLREPFDEYTSYDFLIYRRKIFEHLR